MNETWWLDPSQLDDQQRAILVEPPETEMFVSGPPGSGKTNILVLRANYVRSVSPRMVLVTFTRTLSEFLRSGPNVRRGDQIQASEILTFMRLAKRLIHELGGNVPEAVDFEKDRTSVAEELSRLLAAQRTGKLYDVVFLDEAQSFLPIELNIVRRIATRINAAGDSRQRLFGSRDAISTLGSMVQKTFDLKEHYRIGETICNFADQIMPPKEGEAPLIEGCNYPEDTRPSSVTAISCSDDTDQFARCLERIKTQRRYITDEPIGVLSKTEAQRDALWEALVQDGELLPISIIQRREEYQAFGPDSLVRIMTVASAQGSEFRAVHLLRSDQYGTNQRELAFTAVTRAKTELALYHVRPLPGHMTPPTGQLPQLRDIF